VHPSPGSRTVPWTRHSFRRSPHASRPLADGGGACGGDFGGLDVTVHRAARGRRASVAAGIAVGALLLAVPAPAVAQEQPPLSVSVSPGTVDLQVGGGHKSFSVRVTSPQPWT